MARLAPTIDAELYRGVIGNRRKVVVQLAVDGAYTAATVSDGGILLTPALVGLQQIDYAQVGPSFTADSVEEQIVSVGLSTSSTPGWVFALTDKADDLQSANGTVADVTAFVEVYGF